jgi:DNA-binding FrmR family transcriptional regulator
MNDTDTNSARGHYGATREQILNRLRRAEGQVRGIAGMVEDDRYCVEVLQQISAAQAALDKVALALVDAHMRHGILNAGAEERARLADELMAAVGRLTTRR